MREVDATPKYPMDKAMQENCIAQIKGLEATLLESGQVLADTTASHKAEAAKLAKELAEAKDLLAACGDTDYVLALARAKKIADARKAKEDAENILKELE